MTLNIHLAADMPANMPANNTRVAVQSHPPTPLLLNALPSELRRSIVSYLAPDPHDLFPGCKGDLKSANLAHSCLRAWAPEFMFRDMALCHVLPGMSSHLELFVYTQENAHLLKFVKHILVQVPTAIRWEVGVENPFALHLEEITKQRLCNKFDVRKPRNMTPEQHQYCSDFHRALVEPFTENRQWHQLFRTANATWGDIFRRFANLEKISVGTCERLHHPRFTNTNTFLLRHGQAVLDAPCPTFTEDPTANLSWASTIVCRSTPQTVQSIRLSMANMDNFNSVSTVNQLLSLAYRQLDASQSLLHITRLDLNLCGVAGTHGDELWHGDTASAGSVRFWRKVLNSLQSLQFLALYNKLTTDENIRFSDLNRSDPKASILEWLLPGLVLSQLRTLRISDFLLDKAQIQKTLGADWPRLEKLLLDDVQLMVRTSTNDDVEDGSEYLEHLEGSSWREVCSTLSEQYPNLRIELKRPVSNVNDRENHPLHPNFVGLIQSVPNVTLKTKGPYRSPRNPS